MATTTNYSWTTPDDTGLVKDGASAIRTLGSSVDTTLKNLNPSTTLGDIEYRSSSANVNTRLGIGSTGQILTVSGGVPVWAAPAGGGKVLQVVQSTYSTQVSSSGTGLTDTGLSVNITPSSTSSKVLILVSQNFYVAAPSVYINAGISLLRSTTVIFDGKYALANDNPRFGGFFAANYLDSPATTSAVTYKTQQKTDSPDATIYTQYSSGISSIIALEIGA